MTGDYTLLTDKTSSKLNEYLIMNHILSATSPASVCTWIFSSYQLKTNLFVRMFLQLVVRIYEESVQECRSPLNPTIRIIQLIFKDHSGKKISSQDLNGYHVEQKAKKINE